MHNLWLHHKRAIKYHGICLLGVIIAINRHNGKLVGAFLLAMLVYVTYDKWGRKWQQRGQQMLQRKNP